MSGKPNPLVAILNGLFPLLIAAGVLFVLVMIGGKAVQGYEMRQEARAIEGRIEQLKSDNRRLSEEIEYYHSDEYVEKVAREELGLVRQGDVAVVIVPPEGQASEAPLLMPTPTPAPSPGPAQQSIPVWQRWLSLFVGPE